MYTPIKCRCGHRACKSWQVQGIAPEAKFDEKQARAVAKALNDVEMERDDES